MKRIVLSNLKVLLVTWCLLLAKSVFAAEISGSVVFNTRVAGLVDAKVSRPDGTGAGAGVQAQLFLVGSGGSLTGLTPATTFRTTSDEAKYYVDPITVEVSSAVPGQQVTLRMRAWAGASFENSTLQGESADFSVILGGGLMPPADLVGLSSFSLSGSADEFVTITASAGANGSISPSGTITKNKGANVGFSATPNNGFVVEAWRVNGVSVQTGGTSFTLSNVQESRSVTVSFKQITPLTITITAAAGANGSITPRGTMTKLKGASQSFVATPATGYLVEKWSVNNSVVQTGGGTFTLANVQENRSVFVTFKKKETSFTITAANGANGSISPTGTILKATGESQLFVAKANSGYTVDKWILDGVEVQSSGNTYKLEQIKANHDVRVSFRATGDSIPLILEQPKSVNAHVGSVVSFDVKAGGSAPLTYQWKHNGAPIDGATSATLTLKAVKASDEGNYTVVVSSSVGSTTSASAHLNVKRKRATSDFDDDGNPDILLINADRTLAFWLMNGTNIRTGLAPYKLGEGWKIVGTGDFNKDGKTDVLLQNRDGSLAFWLMEGTSIAQGLVPLRLPDGWQVAATGDFNNDDQTDILLQNQAGSLVFWLMDGTTVSQIVNASFKLPDGWQIIGVGDFNKDGETDILLHHSDRSLAFWLMEGTTLKEGSVRMRVPEGWQVIGLGDFNHDGQTDIMLRHSDRWLGFWFMNGMDIASGEVSILQPDGWEVVGKD